LGVQLHWSAHAECNYSFDITEAYLDEEGEQHVAVSICHLLMLLL